MTERESNLIYWGESGAINEALSDIFGEFVDLTNTGGNDGSSVRWLIGEDLPGGAIRSMSDPTIYWIPTGASARTGTRASEDNRGVHYNSGVANKLAFLLTDGGSFNGQTVTGQGISPGGGSLLRGASRTSWCRPRTTSTCTRRSDRPRRTRSWTAASRDSLEAATPRRRDQRARQRRRASSRTASRARSPGNWQVSVGDYWETVGGNTSATTVGTVLPSGRHAAPPALLRGRWHPDRRRAPSYKPYMDAWVVLRPVPASTRRRRPGRSSTCSSISTTRYDEVYLGRFDGRGELRRLRGLPGAGRVLDGRRGHAGVVPRALQLQGDLRESWVSPRSGWRSTSSPTRSSSTRAPT